MSSPYHSGSRTAEVSGERHERAESVRSHDSRHSSSRYDRAAQSPHYASKDDRESDRTTRRRDYDDRDYDYGGGRDYRDRDRRRGRNSDAYYDEEISYSRAPKRRRSRSAERFDDRRGSRSSYSQGRDRDSGRRSEYRSRGRDSPHYDDVPARTSQPARSPSPQLTEEEREMRSVFVSQISARVMDRELGMFFEQNGCKVRETRVITDRISRRSKGVGYVEFVDTDSVGRALALTGTKLLGIPINVQYTEAEKNRQARDGLPVSSRSQTCLYVGSLNFDLTDSDVRQVFQPFGAIDSVELHRDPVTNKSKGYAFVQFTNAKDASEALTKMNGFSLAGREIRVNIVADSRGAASGAGGGPSGGGHGGGRLDNQLEDGLGGSLNNISRIELMQKLARADRVAEPRASMYRPNIPQAVSRNVGVKNAFDPSEETEPNWDTELGDDVRGEAESKYGKVEEIHVVKESKGEIYIRFDTVESAAKAVEGLNGRWFGGRQISAAHVNDGIFDAHRVRR